MGMINKCLFDDRYHYKPSISAKAPNQLEIVAPTVIGSHTPYDFESGHGD